MPNQADLSRLAAALGGLPILGCLDGSPAAQAGLRYGDVLLSIDGKTTGSWDEFLRARAECRETLLARVFRDGAELEFALPLRASGRPAAEVMSAFLAQRVFEAGLDGAERAEINGAAPTEDKPSDDNNN
jgi:predicted metalloprotease with PDZ domain